MRTAGRPSGSTVASAIEDAPRTVRSASASQSVTRLMGLSGRRSGSGALTICSAKAPACVRPRPSSSRVSGRRLRHLGPGSLPHAPEHMGQQLRPAVDAEVAIEGGHVLVYRLVTHAEAIGRLLLAVALQQAGESLAKPRGELVGARLGDADQGP